MQSKVTHIKMPIKRIKPGYQGFEDDNGDTASTLSTAACIAGVRLNNLFFTVSRQATYLSGHTVHHVARHDRPITTRYMLQVRKFIIHQ